MFRLNVICQHESNVLNRGNRNQKLTTAKKSFNKSSLMTIIYFTNHQKRQFVDFLKKYPCIFFVKKLIKCELQKFASKENQKYSVPSL